VSKQDGGASLERIDEESVNKMRGPEKVSKHDVVVIGAGVAGLCAGAILAQSGKRVLVLERQKQVGGRIAEIQHEGFTIQLGGHIIEDTGSGLGKLFEYLGLQLEDTGIRNNACPVYYDGAWHDIRDYYRDDKLEYRRVVSEIVASSYEDFDKLDDVPLRTWVQSRTKSQGIVDFFESLAKIESMGGDHWYDISASDFLYTRKLHYGERRVAGYSVWPKGGYAKLCEDLAHVICQHGGQVETGVTVSGVAIEDGAVRGVTVGRRSRQANGHGSAASRIDAETVICTLPVWDALKVLPEEKLPPWYVDQIRECSKTSNRTFWIGFYAGLEEPVFAQSPLELTGWMKGPFTGLDGWSFLPSALDPSVAPAGKHLLCCGVVANPVHAHDKAWLTQKFDELDREMDHFFPELARVTLWKQRHKVLNYNIWQRPGLVGMYRPANKVPAVDGLWVAGDTYRSRMIGIDRSARSAITVAEGILGHRIPEFANTWRY
jgi:phytoene dehydrogenase-like protein